LPQSSPLFQPPVLFWKRYVPRENDLPEVIGRYGSLLEPRERSMRQSTRVSFILVFGLVLCSASAFAQSHSVTVGFVHR